MRRELSGAWSELQQPGRRRQVVQPCLEGFGAPLQIFDGVAGTGIPVVGTPQVVQVWERSIVRNGWHVVSLGLCLGTATAG